MLRRGWVALASFAFAGAALATWWVLPRELGAPLARNDLRTNAPEPRAWARPAVRPLESLFLYAEIASAPAEGEPYERHAPVRRDADIFSARGGVAEAAKPFERHAPAPTPARSAAVIDALGRCAEAGDADCLFTLARIDRAAALASGRRAAALSRPEPLRDELLAGLIRFRSDAELAEHLRALGFSDAVPAPTVRDALASRIDAFPARCPERPCRHDRLLATLARLAAPALDGVAFTQTVGEAAWPIDPVLRASAGGRSLHAVAVDFGPFYDVDSAVGFVNALLRERGANVRLAVLASDDGTVRVLAGPEKAIARAAAEGILRVGQASFPMNAARTTDEADGTDGGEVGFQPD